MTQEDTKVSEEAYKQQVASHPDVEIYADGVSGMRVRAGVLKIDLYQSTGVTPDGKGEYRRVSHRVAMPLAAIAELKEFIQQFDAAIAANKKS